MEETSSAMDTDAVHEPRSYTPSVMEASASDRAADLPHPGGSRLRSFSRRVWLILSAAWAAITGLLPHVLHHAGPLAGAALFAGIAGTLLFGALGLIVAIPFLRQMHRRFGTWRAPAIALALFAAVFSLSTFVIGPRIGGETEATPTTPGSPSPPTSSHEAHHR